MLTLPASRNEASDEPEVRFLEGAADAPPAIATWWYPGMKTGWEFIYPREQAMRLAQSSKQPVLTTATDVSSEEMKNAELVRVTPSGQTPVTGDPAATTRPVQRSAARSRRLRRRSRARRTTPAPATPTPQPLTPEPVRRRRRRHSP